MFDYVQMGYWLVLPYCVIQHYDQLNDQQIKNVKKYIGSGAGVNPDLGIHHAMVAMYLGYKIKAKGIEEPKVPKYLKVILFSIHLFSIF
jgi:hypothetical protein